MGGNVSATQKRSRGQERGPRFACQCSAPLSAATLASPRGPSMSFPCRGALLPFGPSSVPSALTAPVTPALPRRTDRASSSEPPCPSPQAGWDNPGSPTSPGAPRPAHQRLPLAAPLPRPPLGLKTSTPFKAPPGHCVSRDAPATHALGSPGPHLSPLKALPLGRLYPRTHSTPAQHLGQGVGHLLHGAGHPVHVAARSRLRRPQPPRDPLGAARPALPAGIRR